MLPFFSLFGFQGSMYGLMIVIGCTLGISLAVFRAPKAGIRREDSFYTALLAGVGMAVGAKLLYLITVLPELVEHWGQIVERPQILISYLTGGFVFYGGLLGALGTMILYTKKFRLDCMAMLELFVPSIPLIHAIGRIGCFCAGCCYGMPIDPPLGMIFSQSIAGPRDVPLLPTQLIESGYNLLLFGILLFMARKKRKKGILLGSYLIGYAVMRFVLEFFRYDAVRGFLFGLSTSQWISLLLLPVGIAALLLPEEHPIIRRLDFSQKPRKAKR